MKQPATGLKRVAVILSLFVACVLVGCTPTASPAPETGNDDLQQQVNDTAADKNAAQAEREAAQRAAEQQAAEQRAAEEKAAAEKAAADEAAAKAAEEQAAKNRGRVVCIDPGHGSIPDSTLTPKYPGGSVMQPTEPGGTSGINTGTPEYRCNLDIALKLQQKLETAGYTVVMCRTTNEIVMNSEDRAKIANDCGADLFIRIHCDGGVDSSAQGFSTLTPGSNEWTSDIYDESMRAAQIMHPIIISELGSADKGIVERTDLAGFNFCDVPALLFECGFLSNPDEELLLISSDYQDKIAQAICDATTAYFDA